ncbi:MAG TPA: hypothetical protein VIV40_06185 [Kofleriaceae bacterium]
MRWMGLLVLAACGAKAPGLSVENAQQQQQQQQQRFAWPMDPRVHEDRPAIDMSWLVPDFHEELRWPLSGMNHPVLEPRFPIAQELAIGLEWQQLCDRGVQNRVSATQKEALSYLHGWCDVMKRDIDSACAHLTPLLDSLTPGLPSAVRHDLANILVDHGDADKAEHWLTKHHIRDIETLDLLAANYVEVGSRADAFAINRRAIDADDHASAATKCRRLVRRIVIGTEADTTFATEELKQFVKDVKVPDPTCLQLYNKVACWQAPESACFAYLRDEQIDPTRGTQLIKAYYAWPSSGTFYDWWQVGSNAASAMPLPGAGELAINALSAALRAASFCPKNVRGQANLILDKARMDPNRAAYEDRFLEVQRDCSAVSLPQASTPAP